MKNENYDFLRNLSTDDIDELSEIMKKYPIIDKSMKDKIINSCEEKMTMKKNNDNLYEVNEPVEVIKKIPWYRKPSFTIAASLAVVIGIAGAGFAGMRNNTPDEQPPISTQLSATNTSEAETTTATSKPITTEPIKSSYISPDSTAKSTETTATTEMAVTRLNDMQSCVAVASLTTTEYVEVVTPFESTGVCSDVPTTALTSSEDTQTSAVTTVDWEAIASSVLATATTDDSGIPPQIHLPCITTGICSGVPLANDLRNETAPAQNGVISGQYTQQQTLYTEPVKSSCTVTTPID